MTDQSGQTDNEATEVDHSIEFARIRQRIEGLGQSINSLRVTADELLQSAASRSNLALLDPPADVADRDDLDQLENSLQALGRHAANVPSEFDPTPLTEDDPEFPTESASTLGHLATAGDVDNHPSAGLGGAQHLATHAPESDDDRSADEANDGAGSSQESAADSGEAKVLEFAPRPSTRPAGTSDEVGFGAVGEHQVEGDPNSHTAGGDSDTTKTHVPDASLPPDVELAFGAMPGEDPSSVAEPVDDAERVPTAATDGLNAIAASESTDPRTWDALVEDDDALDKFFSNDVEPEPAQRWLLND